MISAASFYSVEEGDGEEEEEEEVIGGLGRTVSALSIFSSRSSLHDLLEDVAMVTVVDDEVEDRSAEEESVSRRHTRTLTHTASWVRLMPRVQRWSMI